MSDRWQFYTVECAPVGTHGPFGPYSAADEEMAARIAAARAAHSGLTVARIERVAEDIYQGAET